MTFLCIRSEFMTTFRRNCFFIVTFVLQILGYLWALKEILSYQHHFSFCTSSLTPIGWSCLSVHPSTGRKVHNGLMECFRFFFGTINLQSRSVPRSIYSIPSRFVGVLSVCIFPHTFVGCCSCCVFILITYTLRQS